MIVSRNPVCSPRKRQARVANSASPSPIAIGTCSVPTSSSHHDTGAISSSAADPASCATQKPHHVAVTARV